MLVYVFVRQPGGGKTPIESIMPEASKMPLYLFLALTIFALLSWCELNAQEMPVRLHFKPADHVLGDVHPFFHQGECFLYYLKPGKFSSSLVRSHDLLEWREAPIAHSRVKPDDWMAPWFVLGVFRDPVGQVYRSFYGIRRGRMVSSVSRDLLNWHCAPKEFHVPPANYYRQRRDPFVFWIPEMNRFGCVMTTWMKGGRPEEKGGAVSLATSPDLKQWQDHGAIIDPGDMGQPECPQMFALGGRWYILASIHEEGGVGQPAYWTSKSPLGPWPKAPTGALDGRHLCAAQVAFDGEIPLLFGWIPLTPSSPGKKKRWGGHLALPRELHTLPDGSLGSRLPSMLLERFAGLPWREVPDFPITSLPHALNGEWYDFAVEFTLQMPTTAKAVRVQITPLGQAVLEHDRLRIFDAAGELRSELTADIPSVQAVTVRIFVEADMVEVFVNGRHSLVARVPVRTTPRRLSMQSDGSGAKVSAMRISALKRSQLLR